MIASRVKVGSSLSIGSGKYLMIQRQGDESYRISFGLQAPEGDFSCNGFVDLRDTEATRHLLQSVYYPDWSGAQKDIIRHSNDFCAWPLYTLSPRDMRWESVPGVTLAGDAAHLSHPGGQGVNLAMTDALKLASLIAEHGINNIDQAAREYEAHMFPRAIAAITEAIAIEGAMYGDGPGAFIELICSLGQERNIVLNRHEELSSPSESKIFSVNHAGQHKAQ
jgi:hypothetical protein